MPSGSRPLLILVPDDARGASTRYRVLAHLPALAAAGFAPRVRYPLRGRPRHLWRLLDLLRDAATSSRHDLVLIHRKLYPPAFARRLVRSGRRIVFDLDDAIDLPPPGNAREAARAPVYRRNFEATANVAAQVLCGNAELVRRLPHPRATVLPTPIDTERFRPGTIEAPGSAPVVGWVGHADNLPYLEGLAAPLRALAERHPGLRVKVVCDRPPRLDGLAVDFEPWHLENELSCFGGMTVGVMPLDDSEWSRAKCAFKAIQYMALGIPAVASPVGMNREVIDDGRNGFLAADADAWRGALDRLLGDAALRSTVAAAGRRTIEERYSLTVVSAALVAALDACAP